MAELIWVKPGRDDGRVAFVETHADHPGGDVFVAGPPVQVAKTAKVERALAKGDIVECEAPEAITDAPKPKVVEGVIHKTREEVQEEIAKMTGKGKAPPAAKGKPGVDPNVNWNS